MKETKIRVADMTCRMCFQAVKEAVMQVKGVEDVEIDPNTKVLVIHGDADLSQVVAAIQAIGYHPEVK